MPLNTELERMYSLREVEAITDLNGSTIYRRMKRKQFPEPRQIGPKRVAWLESDLLAWQRNLPRGTKPDQSPARFKTTKPRASTSSDKRAKQLTRKRRARSSDR